MTAKESQKKSCWREREGVLEGEGKREVKALQTEFVVANKLSQCCAVI